MQRGAPDEVAPGAGDGDPVQFEGVVSVSGELAGANEAALDRTLAQLRELGRLEEIDAARVAMVQSMAAALDAEPTRAALWKEYRVALKELMTDDSSSAIDDALADLFGEVRDTPPA